MSDINEVKINFGKRIKALRTRNNMTQLELADKLNVSKSIISAYEKGIRTPAFETIVNLSDIFNVSPGIFFYHPEHEDKEIKTVDVTGLTSKQVAVVETVVRSFRIENKTEND